MSQWVRRESGEKSRTDEAQNDADDTVRTTLPTRRTRRGRRIPKRARGWGGPTKCCEGGRRKEGGRRTPSRKSKNPTERYHFLNWSKAAAFILRPPASAQGSLPSNARSSAAASGASGASEKELSDQKGLCSIEMHIESNSHRYMRHQLHVITYLLRTH